MTNVSPSNNVTQAAFDRAALSLSMCQEKHPVCLSLYLSLRNVSLYPGFSDRNRKLREKSSESAFPARSLAHSIMMMEERGTARKRLKESGSNGDAYHAKANGSLPAGALTIPPTLRQR